MTAWPSTPVIHTSYIACSAPAKRGCREKRNAHGQSSTARARAGSGKYLCVWRLHGFAASRTRNAAVPAAAPPAAAACASASGVGPPGRAAEGTAAFLVLEAAKPWSRKTHKYFPDPARARAVELWPLGFRLSRQYGFPYEDVWMTIVMPHAVTRDYTPPPPPEPAPPRRSARIAGRTKTPPPTHAAYKRAARCLAPGHE